MLRRLFRGGAAPRRAWTFSVVTPSFNQARFLPQCLESVRAQTHRAMEHLVFDPGSSDDSRAIASAAEGVALIAEPDAGQADAVAKGMARSRGDIVAWLNSDDMLAGPGVFRAVLERFNRSDAPDVVYGRGVYVDADGAPIREAYVNRDPATLSQRLAHEVGILQPAVFLRRSALQRIGGPDTGLHFAMDYDLWIRAVRAGLRWAFVDEPLAMARYYADNKTMGRRGESYAEIASVVGRHFGFLDERWARRWAEFDEAGHDGVLRHSGNAGTDTGLVDRSTARLLAAHNSGHAALEALSRADVPAAMHTRAAMSGLGVRTEQICRPVPLEAPSGSGWVCYTVAERRWAFRREWVDAQFARTNAMFDRLRAERRSETAVIVGNGPSLNRTDLSLLDGVDTFVSNYAFLKPELMGRATCLAVVNNLVAEQGAARFNMLRGPTKVFPYWLGYCLSEDDSTCFVPSVGHAAFSTDISQNISWRHTVSFFLMQLAYGLGYRRVALIGFDHSYAQDAALREGEVVRQQADDANHFDPAYFRGKQWHAADTDNMEAMYRLARAAYEADGREIVNATAGGRLEVFGRRDLAGFLGVSAPGRGVGGDVPRVLVVSSTRLGGMSATGAAMRALFGSWPADRLAQLHCDRSARADQEVECRTLAVDPAEAEGWGDRPGGDLYERVVAWIRETGPDVVYYRAIDRPAWMTPLVLAVSEQLGVPVVTHIMDDWPMRESEADATGRVHGMVTELFRRSARALSICDAMSAAFEARYGIAFEAFQNTAELAEWSAVDRSRSVERDGVFRIVYAGSLAEDMTLRSFCELVEAVSELASSGRRIELEVYGARWWKRVFDEHVAGVGCVRYIGFVPRERYVTALRDADLLAMPINFDQRSLSYMRYSMANKSVDYMAAGRPILVYGPDESAAVDYARRSGWAEIVSRRGVAGVRDAIARLMDDAARRDALAARAMETARASHESGRVRERFRTVLAEAASRGVAIRG